MFKPSPFQQAVFDNIASGTGHTIVNAVAGSGKSTTIINGLGYVPTGKQTVFVAFGKKIAQALDEKIKKLGIRGVEVTTSHSYGTRCVTKGLGFLKIQDPKKGPTKTDRLCASVRGNEGSTFDLRKDLAKTVSLAKGSLANTEEEIDSLIESFEIESAKGDERGRFIKDVLAILEKCANVEDGCMDFDDMIWLPLVYDLKQPQFDRVFIDETQDFNAAQIALTLRMVKPDGRILAVGDPRQAIFAFRGADQHAFQNVKSRLNAKELPLSVCYRCSKAVVAEAQTIVPDIEHAPDAIDGDVIESTVSEMYRSAKPGDFILSRTNAPLISLCMQFIQDGRRAMIQGRDIGTSLAVFVKKSKAPTVALFREFVETWRNTECERLRKKDRSAQSVDDKADCLLALSEGADTIGDIFSSIETLFRDANDKSSIVLSSTHQAKGLERERVWLLRWTYMRRPDAEEANLYYVAVTRAIETLVLVHREEG